MDSEEEETATETLTSIHESRFEEMVNPLDTRTTRRLANFLNPLSENPHKANNFLPKTPLLSEIFSRDLHQWPSKVIFRGWYGFLKKWKQWVHQLSPKYSPIWKQAGIHQAILTSVYELNPNPDTVLGLTEYWCSQTNTFLFPWGEATITLEDIMILGGYPVLGDPVTDGNPVLTDEMGKLEEDFKNFRLYILRKHRVQATHYGWLNYFMEEKKTSRGNFVHIAFLTIWLSRFVFPTIADKRILLSLIPTAVKLSQGDKLALGPAVLASLYHNLTFIREEALASRDTIIVSGPFMLLQIWVFERFPVIGPKPVDLLLPRLPRMARWDKLSLKLTLPIVRLAVKEAKNFCWRPYFARQKNWQYPSYCKEKDQLFSNCSSLDDDLKSFHRFLLASEVVGMNCKEKYFPHRVAMQFGFDQGIPAHLSSVRLGCREPSQLFVPSRFSQPCVTLGYSKWWEDLMLARQGKFKDVSLGKNRDYRDTKNGHLVSSSVQASGNSQDYHATDAALNPFDSESESSLYSSFQNNPSKVSQKVHSEDKRRAKNDNVVIEEWNEADAGKSQTDIPTMPSILKGSSSTIAPPPGFQRLSSNDKKRLYEVSDNEGNEPVSLPCEKKAKVAKTEKEIPVSIQTERCKTGVSNVNLVKREYVSDDDNDDDDVVIISHLEKGSNKCGGRKEKSPTRESFKVSEPKKNIIQSSEVNTGEKMEPVKRAGKDVCDFATEAGGFHIEIKVEPGDFVNKEPFNVGFDVKHMGKDSSKEQKTSVAKGGERKMAGESASNPINLDEDTPSAYSVTKDVLERLSNLEKIMGVVKIEG